MTLLPAYVARRVERRRDCVATAVPAAWGYLYRVTWTDSGFNHRSGNYHASVRRVEWIAFDPHGHLVATSERKADAVCMLSEEREEPGLHASAWVSTWREVGVEP